MSQKRHTRDQIIQKLREVEEDVRAGRSVIEICRKLGISESTYHRWKKLHGGPQYGQPGHLKQLAEENARLKKLVAELYLDNLVLKESAGEESPDSEKLKRWSSYN